MDIKAKIEKLLAKTVENSCTMEEAAAAAKMVQKLIGKYHIELAEIGDEPEKADGERLDVKSVRKWEIRLVSAIARNMRCEAIVSHRYTAGNVNRKSFVYIIGMDADRKAVILLYNKLRKICKVGMKKEQNYHKKMFGTSKGIAESYGFGFTQAIKGEMEKQAKALVLVTPKEVDDKIQELFPNAKTRHVGVTCNTHAYNSGVNDGRNAMRTPAIG
jgi:hypothetical protein